MAEAAAVLGSVAAVVQIVTSISKTIMFITDITAKWRDADLLLINLSSQLTALRAACTQIEDWISHSLQGALHQLVMDLKTSISCCKMLMEKVESFFSDLAVLTEKPLDFRPRFKIVFGSAGPESVQRLIDHQTSECFNASTHSLQLVCEHWKSD